MAGSPVTSENNIDDPEGPLSTVGSHLYYAQLTVAQANRSCADIGVENLVLELQLRNTGPTDTDANGQLVKNAGVGVEVEKQVGGAYSALPDLAKACIDHLVEHKCDFGTAYSLYCLGYNDQWKQKDVWGLSKYSPTLCSMDGQPQGHHLQTDSTGLTFIKSPLTVYPRRIWDLASHRVIPFEWYMDSDMISEFKAGDGRITGIVAISHSWAGANDRGSVLTPVNKWEWPVPLPTGVTLESLREQLWEQGAQSIPEAQLISKGSIRGWARDQRWQSFVKVAGVVPPQPSFVLPLWCFRQSVSSSVPLVLPHYFLLHLLNPLLNLPHYILLYSRFPLFTDSRVSSSFSSSQLPH